MPSRPPSAESIRLSVSSIRTSARAIRAQRQTQRNFARAQRRARHQQVRQVRASDQQHGDDGRHQHAQRQPHLRTDDPIDVAIDGGAPALLDVGIARGDARRDRAHLGLRLFEGHAGLEPGDRARDSGSRAPLSAGNASGIQRSAERRSNSLLPGSTPMTVYGSPFSRMSRPTIDGSAANRFSHSRWPITATFSRPG